MMSPSARSSHNGGLLNVEDGGHGEVLPEGEPLGLVDALADAEAEAEGLVDAVGLAAELLTTGSLQGTPLRAKSVGTGLLEVQLPLKPKLTVPPVPMLPL